MATLVNLANVMFLCAYLVRDVFVLRSFAVCGGVLLLIYYVVQPVPLTEAATWQTAFISINTFWVWKLYMERRPVRLTSDETRLRRLALRALTPQQTVLLLGQGTWRCADPGETLLRAGVPTDRLLLLSNGRATVEEQGRTIALVGGGNFLGTLPFFTDAPPEVTITTTEPTFYIEWEREKLRRFLRRKPDLQATFQTVLGSEMGRLLLAFVQKGKRRAGDTRPFPADDR